MNSGTWYRVLTVAEANGWNPLGTICPNSFEGYPDPEGYVPEDWMEGEISNGRLVLLEDSLNLADALERAFLAYEPDRAYPPALQVMSGSLEAQDSPAPGIGVISALVDFCRFGAFWVEKHTY